MLFDEWTKASKGRSEETDNNDIEVIQVEGDGGIAVSEQS